MQKINILLIKPNIKEQSIFIRHLTQLNKTNHDVFYNPTPCFSLQEAKEVIKNTDIDIVIFEDSPIQSQSASIIHFFQHNYGVNFPIIVVVGINDIELYKEAMLLGAQDFLTKGDITPKHIHTTITHSLDRTNKQKELEATRLQQEQLIKMATLGEMAGNIAHEINGPITSRRKQLHYLLNKYKKKRKE